MHVCHLPVADRGQNIVLDHRPIVDLRTGRLLGEVFVSIPFGEVTDGWRLATVLPFLCRVFSPIDPPAKLFRLGAGGFCAPIGIGSDCEALFPAINAIIDKERYGAGRAALARSEYTDSETREIRVPKCLIGLRRLRLIPFFLLLLLARLRLEPSVGNPDTHGSGSPLTRKRSSRSHFVSVASGCFKPKDATSVLLMRRKAV